MGKIGEASGVGELSCFNKVGETSQLWKLPCYKQGWRKSWCKICFARTREKVMGRLRGWRNLPIYGSCLKVLERSNSTQGRALLRNLTLCHHIGDRHKTAHQNNSNLLRRKEVGVLKTQLEIKCSGQ